MAHQNNEENFYGNINISHLSKIEKVKKHHRGKKKALNNIENVEVKKEENIEFFNIMDGIMYSKYKIKPTRAVKSTVDEKSGKIVWKIEINYENVAAKMMAKGSRKSEALNLAAKKMLLYLINIGKLKEDELKKNVKKAILEVNKEKIDKSAVNDPNIERKIRVLGEKLNEKYSEQNKKKREQEIRQSKEMIVANFIDRQDELNKNR